MNVLLIFATIYGAMIANAFWEAYVEGKHAWDEGKLGWKLQYKGFVILTAYHFWLFFVMYPLLLLVPFFVYGWDWRLFGILTSAYFSGLILEDAFWFIVNPRFKIEDWNSKKVTWYPWIKICWLEIPAYYLVSIAIALSFWLLLWR
jgi:hypothetical protein